MISLFLVGIDGKMGRMVSKRAAELGNFKIVGGFDKVSDANRNVFNSVKDINVDFDCVIDFSRPEAVITTVEIARKFLKPAVIATTGLSDAQTAAVTELSKEVPVFLSGNMSVGVHVLRSLVAEAVKKLFGSFDVEIIERHHNEKQDAPSGTAKMLENTIGEASDNKANFLYGRYGGDCKRVKNDVTVHSVRGGTIVGEHEVIFAGNDEIIEIKHTALSRIIFADGALKAAEFLQGKKSGLYQMKDIML